MQQKNEGLATSLRRFGNGARMVGWRLPAIDTYPRLIAFTQTLGGKLMLFALFAFFMKQLGGDLRMVAAAAVVSISGRYRYLAAMLCTGVILALNPQWFDFRAVYITARHEAVTGLLNISNVRMVTLLASAPLLVTLLWLARRFRDHPIGRRPVLASHLVLLLLLALSASKLLHGTPQVILWSITAVYAAYFWFLAYALIDQRRKQPAPLSLQLASFHPFFGSSTTPLGKGADNWRSVEAQTPEELAVTQLKGLKLIVWAYFLSLVLFAYVYIVHRKLGIVPLEIAFERYVQSGVSPGPSGILGIITNFFGQVLHLTIWGNSIVAVGRLAGFRLLRNTWRPLSSRTIAEFWNRYYYYFKELLVHVYFYPSYVRYFKRYPRLRIAFATFMAAGVGNWLFHFLLENYRIARDGVGATLAYMETYAFYCLLLATGIIISQLRAKRPPADAGWLRGQFMPSLGVITFYCMLSFFDGPQRHEPLKVHLAFLFHVFGF